MTNENSNDADIWKQIQETFNQIKQDAGVEPEEDYMKELESILGMSVDEMNESHMVMMKTRSLGVEEINIPPFGRALIPTGIKLSIPEEYEIQIRPKSGLALNQGLTVLNTPGTVDSGYVGEIKVIVFNTNNATVTVSKGMKIAQAVLCPVMCGKYVSIELMDNVGDKDRMDNGFGSTGL